MYEIRDAIELPQQHATLEEKTFAWRAWVARETQLRTLLGLFIIDGVTSQFSGDPTVARQASNPLPMPADEVVFNAESPDAWIRKMSDQPDMEMRFCDIFNVLFSPDPTETLEVNLSLFCVEAILEGVYSLVSDTNRLYTTPIGAPSQLEICGALVKLREYILSNQYLSDNERSTALLRWHAVSLDMVAKTARGIRRMCAANGITQHIFGGVPREEYGMDPLR